MHKYYFSDKVATIITTIIPNRHIVHILFGFLYFQQSVQVQLLGCVILFTFSPVCYNFNKKLNQWTSAFKLTYWLWQHFFPHAASLLSSTMVLLFLQNMVIFALGTLSVPVGWSVYFVCLFFSHPLLWWLKILILITISAYIISTICPSLHWEENTGFSCEDVQHQRLNVWEQ